jgi:HSF-type DNA-binding
MNMGQLKDAKEDGSPVDMKLPFPCKLYILLDGTEANKTSHVISWFPDGKSFRVHDIKTFTDKIMPSYFSQTKFNSFRRQCYIYGFRVRRDGSFFHPEFRRGDVEASLSLRRNQGGDRRRKKTNEGPSTVAPKKGKSSSCNKDQSSTAEADAGVTPRCPSIPLKPPPTKQTENVRFDGGLVEQTSHQEGSDPSPVLGGVKDLAYLIFENRQLSNAAAADVVNLDFSFKETDFKSLEDVFRTEAEGRQPTMQPVIHQI